MAWLDCERSGIFQIGFSFGGERFTRSLKTRSERDAHAAKVRVEENIRLVTSGRLAIPNTADVAAFLLSDRKIQSRNIVAPKGIKLGDLFACYERSLPANSLAAETLRIAEIHMRHIGRLIGPRRWLRTLSRNDLQKYINSRSTKIGKRGKPVSTGTVRKELSTFRTLWRWGKQAELVAHDFPNEGLRFPRARQKQPFSTWDQIEKRIRRGLVDGQVAADHWDCLYLNKAELDALLATVKEFPSYGFLHPMCHMAAHTGVRRSELCRSMQDDIDFESNSIVIREKKRRKGCETFRHVPMSPSLKHVLATWLGSCTPSAYTFPAEHHVLRTRNSNRRENDGSVAPDEATDHFETALSKTKWSVVRGWHLFRHSFVSNCASLGVDQRMIDAWVTALHSSYAHYRSTHGCKEVGANASRSRRCGLEQPNVNPARKETCSRTAFNSTCPSLFEAYGVLVGVAQQ